MVKVEISNGDLIDKVTILKIKLQKIKSASKLENIRKEYSILESKMKEIGLAESSQEFQRLFEINSRLWQIEDKIRLKESKQEFDEKFIRLARDVYFQNDERAKIKRQINTMTNSGIVEEKEYINYRKR